MTVRRVVATALSVGLVVAGSACSGSSGSSGSSPSGTPEPSRSSAITGSASSSSSASASASSTATVTAAAGPLLQQQTASLHAPAGWTVSTDQIVSYESAAVSPHSLSVVELIDQQNFAGSSSLDRQARFAVRQLPKQTSVVRLPDVDLDGTPAYHLHYTTTGDQRGHDQIGTERHGRVVQVNLDLSPQDLASDPTVIAAVLASFRWS